ncbi:DNA (cytosine-5-)-methyltransferase [Nocardioides sp. NBC_00368]|uniref:DNA (cytosine-5-)-methyltransferase n=1 Tax=Nocardioides sp. NBC_00368 TaxID=2976000 RepID=UPI002E1D8E58
MSERIPSQPAVFDRGMPLKLASHAEHVDGADELVALCARMREENPDLLLAADLFSGAGGMSLGLEDAGMRVVFGADFDADALATHTHHFGGMSVGWDLGDTENVDKVGEILRSVEIDVIAGGPPCQPFSKAGRSKMRHLVREGLRDPHDRRRDLWQSYVDIIRMAKPRAVIMENVPDMALDREMFILRGIVKELEDEGYSVQERVVETSSYGVPQFRQRLILIALRSGAAFTWPEPTEDRVTLSNAISDLPSVDPKAGWQSETTRTEYKPYGGAVTPFQQEMRSKVSSLHRHRIYDHVTRKVRDDDLIAFEHLDTKTKYSELPDELKRYRDDIFDDKYKRLDGNDLSRTITAHIAKDGYWYIHPKENRTLTVREAARIQTFPDNFRFAGSPTSAFRQIGNAVPPFLGRAVGRTVARALSDASALRAVSSSQTSSALAAWFAAHEAELEPWITSRSRWLAIVGELILGDARQTVKDALWPHFARVPTPKDFVAEHDRMREICAWIDRGDAADRLLAIAETLVDHGVGSTIPDAELEFLVDDGMVASSVAEIAMLVQSDDEEPVVATAGALRVAGRFFNGYEGWVRNRNSDGRIAIARLIGNADSTSRKAHLALIEVGQTVCTPKAPDCGACPLALWCERYIADQIRGSSKTKRVGERWVAAPQGVEGLAEGGQLALLE